MAEENEQARFAAPTKAKSPFPNREGASSGESSLSQDVVKPMMRSVERHAHPGDHEVDILLQVFRDPPVAGIRGRASPQVVSDAHAP